MNSKLDDKLDIKVLQDDGTEADFTIFMSYGLLGQLSSVIGDLQRVPLIDTDPDLAGTVLAISLVPRRPNGRPTVDLEKFEAPGLSLDTAEKIFSWVKAHIMGFSLRRVTDTTDLVKARQEDLKKIGSSLVGLAGSTSSQP